jgi:hypothetical protein
MNMVPYGDQSQQKSMKPIFNQIKYQITNTCTNTQKTTLQLHVILHKKIQLRDSYEARNN